MLIMTKQPSRREAGWKLEHSYSELPEPFYARQAPVPVRQPELVILNEPLAAELGLDAEALQSPQGVQTLAGNLLPEGSEPLAQAYAGHQFGSFTMLGDGRAILLGEQITPSGRRMDIQLKGSGRTPYSRQGDGRAALGPMLREYVISEAMHALGIPTTRSLAVVSTGEEIVREWLLDGAILTRVASSHLRVGTFQFAASQCTKEQLRALADYAIKRHFPSCADAGRDAYLALLKQVVTSQAQLIAQWQLVGFVHGVMNTDNMTISGETIDYGPCAWMDTYDLSTVFSSIDVQGRYAYGHQPRIAAWNLARFAESLLVLLHDDEDQAVKLAEEALAEFAVQYERFWLDGMRGKLGLSSEEEEDRTLIQELLSLMEKGRADYTNTFRVLTLGHVDSANRLIGSALFDSHAFKQWQQQWQARLSRDPLDEEASRDVMRRHNPAVIPRNHRVEEALEAAVEHHDYSVLKRLVEALSNPYSYTADQDDYAVLPERTDKPYRTYCGT